MREYALDEAGRIRRDEFVGDSENEESTKYMQVELDFGFWYDEMQKPSENRKVKRKSATTRLDS